jgi:hypothetical protein
MCCEIYKTDICYDAYGNLRLINFLDVDTYV